MNFTNAFIRGSVTPVLLALLRDGPGYAYDMVRLVHTRSGGRIQWQEGSLYPALAKLERAGLISGQWKTVAGSGGGKRRRRYYSLTRAGRAELARRVTQWREFSSAINALLGVR
jgi:DNA-binding PadR family transcriptional regulator